MLEEENLSWNFLCGLDVVARKTFVCVCVCEQMVPRESTSSNRALSSALPVIKISI